AVILERASGQLIMSAVGVGCLLSLFLTGTTSVAGGEAADRTVVSLALPLGAVGLAIGLALVWARSRALARRARPIGTVRTPGWGVPSHRAVFWADTRRALLSRESLLVQMAGSLLVVTTYVGIFALGARALGITTPMTVLIPLVP